MGLGRLRPDRRDAADRRRVAVRGGRPARDRDGARRGGGRRQRLARGRAPLRRRHLDRLRAGAPRAGAAARRGGAPAGARSRWPTRSSSRSPTRSFDVVLSTFGVMFAPDQERAASELMRVAKPGGRIGLASWTAEGFIGRLFEIVTVVRASAGGAALAHGLGRRDRASSSSSDRAPPTSEHGAEDVRVPLPLARSTGSSTSAPTTGRRTRPSPRSTRPARRRSRPRSSDFLREWNRRPEPGPRRARASTSRRW